MVVDKIDVVSDPRIQKLSANLNGRTYGNQLLELECLILSVLTAAASRLPTWTAEGLQGHNISGILVL